jgi:hypothetical protein
MLKVALSNSKQKSKTVYCITTYSEDSDPSSEPGLLLPDNKMQDESVNKQVFVSIASNIDQFI